MALKRSRDDRNMDGGPKKQKMGDTSDPRSNPYLAHMYPGSDDDEDGGVSIAQQPANPTVRSSYASYQKNGVAGSGSMGDFKRHQTTAKQAKVAEDGPTNPFTGRELSKGYFNILRTRRNLPVHTQRYGIYSRPEDSCSHPSQGGVP